MSERSNYSEEYIKYHFSAENAANDGFGVAANMPESNGEEPSNGAQEKVTLYTSTQTSESLQLPSRPQPARELMWELSE